LGLSVKSLKGGMLAGALGGVGGVASGAYRAGPQECKRVNDVKSSVPVAVDPRQAALDGAKVQVNRGEGAGRVDGRAAHLAGEGDLPD